MFTANPNPHWLMPRGAIRFVAGAGALAWLAVLVPGCQPSGSLQAIQATGQLRVLTLNDPTCYYLGSHGGDGFEYRLANAFARQLGVQLVVRPVRDLVTAREQLERGEADMIAAQVSDSDSWRQAGLLTDSYREIPQLVIQRLGAPRPENVAALRGKRLVVWAGSPQQRLLGALRSNGASYLTWTELPRDQADPLDWVASRDADYAIVDQTRFEYARFVHPEVSIAFALGDPRETRWVVRRNSPALRAAANEFLAQARRDGLLRNLEKAVKIEAADFEYLEAARFRVDVASKLPALREWFEAAAASTGLDWRLLAAVGYQESHWNPQSASRDGASGIMMLTGATARAVGVSDRSDPQQSILGGALYLEQVMDMIPDRITEPDRTWLALAAYNVGFGHLEDARILTQMHGKDPDRWADVRDYLPLLAQEPWYLQAKRGYARGWEPVRYVEQVRSFLAVLQWYDIPLEDLRLSSDVPDFVRARIRSR